MSNDKMPEKEIAKAIKNTEYFATCKPADMLKVMVREILTTGNVDKEHLKVWDEVGEKESAITPEGRFDQVIEVLENRAPSKPLDSMLKSGLLAYCMPGCFPVKGRIARQNLRDIIDKFDQMDTELPIRITLLLYPFGHIKARELLRNANFDDDAVELIYFTIKYIEDFILIKDTLGIKRFVYDNGLDYFNYMYIFGKQLQLAIDFPEYKIDGKKALLDQVYLQKEPILPSDLVISKEDLRQVGITDDEEATEMMGMLTEHCHAKPGDNKKDKLLKRAKTFKHSKLKRRFRRVVWIK